MMTALADKDVLRASVERERLLRVLAAPTFLIFFQGYMVAPLIPRLSRTFGVSIETIGLIVPAYMIPYGISTLFYGLFSDHLGRWRFMRASLLDILRKLNLHSHRGSPSVQATPH